MLGRGGRWGMLGAPGTGLAATSGAVLGPPRCPALFGSCRLRRFPAGAGASHGAAFQAFKERLTRFGARRGREEPEEVWGGGWEGEWGGSSGAGSSPNVPTGVGYRF